MDDVDRAQERFEKYLDRCIDAARGIPSPGHASKYCVDCEAEIPEARRLANPECSRCVECQEARERGK